MRGFVASGDLCSDITFSSRLVISAETPVIKEALASVSFDPEAKPAFHDLFYYATVLFNHNKMKAAAPIYEQALTLLSQSLPADKDTLKWRRVATDQAAMSYGGAGDLQKARSILSNAVAADPGYPLNYYNLACADAEQGNAAGAKFHLQQAFDRRANTIAGESLPDPTEDYSLLKLKSDTAFWTFVEALQKGR